METFDTVTINLIVRETLDQFLQRDPRLEPGERCPEAEVDAVTEGKMSVDCAICDVAVWVGEPPRIPVGRSVDEKHDRSLRYLLAMALDGSRCNPALVVGRGIEAQ